MIINEKLKKLSSKTEMSYQEIKKMFDEEVSLLSKKAKVNKDMIPNIALTIVKTKLQPKKEEKYKKEVDSILKEEISKKKERRKVKDIIKKLIKRK